MRYAGLDSGKHRDAMAFVGTEVTEGKLYVRGAKRWMGRDYLDVEDYIINKIHKSKPFDQYVVEINNTGTHVAEVLQRADLPIRRVFTSKEIKDMKKKSSPNLMDKNEMVRLMAHWFQDGSVVFPSHDKLTIDLAELKRQLTIFAEVKSESGSVAYRAEGSEHDDLVMALMLACFGAKPLIGNRNVYTLYPVHRSNRF